jgi:hypothetical protein
MNKCIVLDKSNEKIWKTPTFSAVVITASNDYTPTWDRWSAQIEKLSIERIVVD